MGNSCYRMIYEPASWEEAGVKCRSLARGSHLIVVEDETESLAVVQYLLSIKGAKNVIIFCVSDRIVAHPCCCG